MRGEVKRGIHAGVGDAVRALDGAGFKQHRKGYWLSSHEQTRWELEVVFEQEHGEGNFRLEWGVRASGVTEILEREEINHAMDCTVAGDVGSLALRQRGMTFLVLSADRAGWLRRRLLKEIRFQTSDDLTRTVREWLVGPLLSTLRPLTTYVALAEFLQDAEQRLGPWFDYPERQSGRDLTAAAVWALAGDRKSAMAVLDRWWASGVDQDFHRPFRDRVAQRIVAVTCAQ